MADVDYMKYAAYMGARNPVAEGLSQVGETLDLQKKQSMQQQTIDRQNRLADMQIYQQQMALKKAQEEEEYQQGLKAAMQTPQTTANPASLSQMGAYTPAALRYAQMSPEQQAFAAQAGPNSDVAVAKQQYDLANAPAVPEKITESPTQAGVKYAVSQGRQADAIKMISLDDQLAQYKAKIETAGGDPAQYYKAEAEIEGGKKFLSTVKDFSKTPGLLKSMWPQIVQMFPKESRNVTPESFIQTSQGILTPLTTQQGQIVPDRYYMLDDQGKMHMVDLTPKADKQQLTEIPSPDGKTAQKAFVSPDGTVTPVGQPYKVKSQVTNINVAGKAGGMTGDAVDLAADQYLLTGQMPALGMGGATQKMAILNRAAAKAKEQGLDASGVITEIATTKANAGSLAQQQKQVGAMGSFVKNIDKQVGRFEELSKELASFDSRLLNVPLRAVRGRVAGSPNQAKIDMYLAEISSETGKLASGATGSVAELSQGAREKWEKIHDPNLSMADLLSLLKETRHAGVMRMDSVNEQIMETKTGMRNRGSKSQQGGSSIQDSAIAEMKRRGL